MADNVNANPNAAAAAQYVFVPFMFEIMLEFLGLLSILDMFYSSSHLQMLYAYSSVVCLTSPASVIVAYSQLVRMTSLVSVTMVRFYLLFISFNSFGKLLVFPTKSNLSEALTDPSI